MLNINAKPEKKEFNELILASAKAIKEESREQAMCFIKLAASLDIERPEPYNLLGIIYEQQGDNYRASRFYRVAYYIDQTFKAANDNLERVSDMFYRGFIGVNFGTDRCEGVIK